MEESITWQIKSKSGFSTAQRKKIAYLLQDLAGAGSGGGDVLPSNLVVDKNGVPVVDKNGVYVVTE